MGLIIEELRDRKPELPYFDDSFTGEYPEEAPFTISELEEIYPAASAKSKKMLHLQKELMKLHLSYRAVTRHVVQYGIIS